MPNIETERKRIDTITRIMVDYFGHDLIETYAMLRVLYPNTKYITGHIPNDQMKHVINVTQNIINI